MKKFLVEFTVKHRCAAEVVAMTDTEAELKVVRHASQKFDVEGESSDDKEGIQCSCGKCEVHIQKTVITAGPLAASKQDPVKGKEFNPNDYGLKKVHCERNFDAKRGLPG